MKRPEPARPRRAIIALAAALIALPAAADVVGAAREAAAAGEHAAALARIDAWLEQHPGDREALFARAQVLAWSGDHAGSRRAYDALLVLEPDNADYLLGRAQAWLWGGEPARALADIRAARAVAPGYAALDELEQRALAALPPPPKDEPRGEASAEGSWERLDHGLDDWRSLAARIRLAATTALELRGSIAEVSRYGRSDTEGGIGASWSGDGAWTVGADLSSAGSARFLPEWSLQLQAARRVASATRLQATYRRAEYRNTVGETYALSAEHYFARYRVAYALIRGEPSDARATWAHTLRADLYYGESNSIGLQLATGEESESDGAGGLLVSRIRGAGLLGRQALTPDWTLSWALTWHEQGDLYRRAGANVGIARRF